ncbi:MAG: DNA repair exonuclease [Deltaproteobacteria bacterium]|nr:DNA repair exonuclease [Deltaproteobacteria bacterium]
MIKFIHAADIHLDSPLRGLENYEGAPVEEIRGATRKALVNLIDLALEEKVSFVIISGDMYDGDWKDYNTGLFLLRQLSKLTSNGMNVFIVKGNHDAESKITKDLKLPQGIKIFSSKQPETVSLESKGIAIHGQSFATPAVKEDLASNYPPAVKDMFNIGVLHTSVNGREGHENYAPCSIDTLKSKNYNYWALGHIHKKEILSENPWIVFPGNIQGRHIKETGFKGCMIVSIEEDSNVSVEFRNLYSLVWSFCNTAVN